MRNVSKKVKHLLLQGLQEAVRCLFLRIFYSANPPGIKPNAFTAVKTVRFLIIRIVQNNYFIYL